MKQFLIIEDDPIIAHIYRQRLEKVGYQVSVAKDGEEGLRLAATSKPQAILLDLMLPKMNGLEVLTKIKAEQHLREVPVFVFTNAYLPKMVEAARRAGAAQVYNKAKLTPLQVVYALQEISPKETENAEANAASLRSDEEKPDESLARTRARRILEPNSPDLKPDPNSPLWLRLSEVEAPSMQHLRPPSPGLVHLDIAVGSSLPPERALSNDDPQLQAELLLGFLEAAPSLITEITKPLKELSRCDSPGGRANAIALLYRHAHAFAGHASLSGLQHVAQIASALEAFVKTLHDKPGQLTPSTIRTLAQAIDLLVEFFEKGTRTDLVEKTSFEILVVDDEALSRRAVIRSLELAQLTATAVESPKEALVLARRTHFDLIFLDVSMPEMDGFELCTRLRALPGNQEIPIVFVTNLTDFHSRVRSCLSGGNDLIAKPFLFVELSVKALTYVLRRNLAQSRQCQDFFSPQHTPSSGTPRRSGTGSASES